MIVQHNQKSRKIIPWDSNDKNLVKLYLSKLLILFGWGIRIRTLINGVRVRFIDFHIISFNHTNTLTFKILTIILPSQDVI
jgi:hypothetical protein